MAEMMPRSGGIYDGSEGAWRSSLARPQPTSVPSERSARVCDCPAAMATTRTRFDGTEVCPREFSPQAMTVPSERRATLCDPPAAMATTLLSVEGTFVWPLALLPQAITVPSARRARLCVPPAAMDTMLVAEDGMLVCALGPRATTTPSGRRAITGAALTPPLLPAESMQTFVAASGTRNELLPQAATLPRARIAFELVAEP